MMMLNAVVCALCLAANPQPQPQTQPEKPPPQTQHIISFSDYVRQIDVALSYDGQQDPTGEIDRLTFLLCGRFTDDGMVDVGPRSADEPFRLPTPFAVAMAGDDALMQRWIGLLDPDYVPLIRGIAATLLGQLGPRAASALPKLARMAGETNWSVSSGAIQVIHQVAGDDVGLLLNWDPTDPGIVTLGYVRVLSAYGKQASAGSDHLLTLLPSVSDVLMRAEVIDAIGRVADDPKRVLPALEREANAGPTDETISACNAISDIGPGAADAIGLLRRLVFDNDDCDTEWAAIRAVGKVTTDPDLIEQILTSDKVDVKEGQREAATTMVASFTHREQVEAMAMAKRVIPDDTVPASRRIVVIDGITQAECDPAPLLSALIEIMPRIMNDEVRTAVATAMMTLTSRLANN